LKHRSPTVSGLKIFLGVLFLLLAWAPAVTWWGDGKEACLGAHSWIHTGKPLTLDPEGKAHVSLRPLLFTVSCLPTATLLPLPTPDESPLIRLARALPPALFGAGCAAMFFLILLQLRTPARAATALSIALVFATPLWIYSRIHYSEGLQTLINLCLLYFVIRPDRHERYQLFFVGFLIGMLINLRATNALVIPFVLVALRMGDSGRTLRARSWALVMAGLAPWILAFLDFNQLRYGSWLMTGYESVSIWRHPLTGLYGQLFSPGKSIFAYAPLTLAGVWFFVQRLLNPHAGLRMAKGETLALVFFLANLVVYSSWWAWGGGWAWGPRFLVPFMPLMLVPIAQYVSWTKPTKALTFCLSGLAVAGALVQAPATLVGVHQLLQFLGLIDRAAFKTQPVYGAASEDMIFSTFVPDFSPVIMQFKLLAQMMAHRGPFTWDFSSWAGPDGPFRVPGFSGRIVEFDALQPDVWFWTTTQDGELYLFAAVAVVLAVIGIALLVSVFRSAPSSTLRTCRRSTAWP
jgi:hypothetical protein